MVLKLKTGEHLFIEVLGCCGLDKLLVQCGSHQKILCWSVPDFIIRKQLKPYVMCFFVFLWYERSLLTVIWTPHKLQCNCRVHMNGQQVTPPTPLKN